MSMQGFKHFFHVRRKLFAGYLISLGVFTLFNLFIFVLNYQNPMKVALQIPFALLLPFWWAHVPAVIPYNALISALPICAVIGGIMRYRNGTIVAVSHIALVLYWWCVFGTIVP